MLNLETRSNDVSVVRCQHNVCCLISIADCMREPRVVKWYISYCHSTNNAFKYQQKIGDFEQQSPIRRSIHFSKKYSFQHHQAVSATSELVDVGDTQ